ncbi:hypothetical protein GIB67_026916 [Kingdonia uniflora]|uniref:GDSL esterase/lipase n=1 Tax=Kingdonia uniflora TaxID=39325 RepID=A0A7J7P1C0_9MAGN|nr:hypothetical protein GIB67_026916 [Kingdonia uniflora]
MVSERLTHLFKINLLVICFGQAGAKVPAIIVFGDSTVDAGNNNYYPTIVRSNFAPYGRDFEGGKPTGRFTNGRLATDFYSEAFGIKPFIPAYLDPAYSIKDFATGVTFASAGTGFDNVTSNLGNVVPFWKQLEYFKEYRKRLTNYLGRNKANELIREALYITSIGTNDFILNYFVIPIRSSQFTVDEYQNFLLGILDKFVYDIYRLGARKIAVGGLPPIGCLPLIRTTNFKAGSACREEFNNLAREFSDKTIVLCAKWNLALRGIRVVVSNLLDVPLQVIRNPHLYGFDSVAVGCCGTGTIELSYLCKETSPFTCKDANKYVFFDAVHPSEKLYRIVADHLMKTTLSEFL